MAGLSLGWYQGQSVLVPFLCHSDYHLQGGSGGATALEAQAQVTLSWPSFLQSPQLHDTPTRFRLVLHIFQ